MKIIAFTGTRAGMTHQQKEEVADLLVELTGLTASIGTVRVEAMEFDHGACDGSDRDFHSIVTYYRRDLNRQSVIHMHPAFPDQRDWARQYQSVNDVIHPIDLQPTRRTRHMINKAQTVIACPRTKDEEWRGSGTWAGIRYARKLRRHLIIVWPDGTTKEENKQ